MPNVEAGKKRALSKTPAEENRTPCKPLWMKTDPASNVGRISNKAEVANKIR